MRLKSKQRQIGFSLSSVPNQNLYEMHFYSLRTYYALGIMLGAGENTVNKADIEPAFMDLTAKSIGQKKTLQI